MDYEKKYKNALEWARRVMNGETGFIRKEVEEVFPELKESEDEMIRKALISGIKQDMLSFQTIYGIDLKKVLIWLEKQKAPKWSNEHPNELPCYKQVINNLSKAMEE